MKLRFLKNDSLYILKESIRENIENYDSINSLWINDVTSNTTNYIDFKQEVNDFNLITSDIPEKNDLENIKILYTNLINITDSQASDERLWAGLCHDKFWEYMQKRWPLEKAKDKYKYIKKNYFFAHGEKRSLMTNGLARLWWIGRLTYDSSNIENPFELTEYLAKDLNGRGFPLFGSNISNNKKVLKVFLKTLKDYEENNEIISREVFLEMVKSLNMWCGKILVDSLNEELLKEKILNRLSYVLSRK